MSKHYEELKPYLEKIMALQTAKILFEWDNETLAPKDAGAYTSKVVGALSAEYFQTVNNDKVKDLIKRCQEDSSLSDVEKAVVRELYEEQKELSNVPQEEYREFAQLVSESTRVWSKAKEEKDFDAFAPTLEKIVDFQKKFASYRASEGQKLYDVMLDTYEKGFDMETLDAFFKQLKDELVPFLKQVTDSGKKMDDSFLTGGYDTDTQAKLARFLAEYVGFDFDKGILAVSAHPFTTNLHNHDVRITTHYGEKVDSSIFSVIHEAGHGIYELGIADALTQTLAGQGASMGMHESQSRFFENIIGRNEAFWKPIYHRLKEMFPKQLSQIPLNRFIEAVNQVSPGLIRIEADELTYSLHIMIRYELEKQLMSDEIKVEDLEKLWEEKYEEYLGVRPKDASEGVLQDIHWSQGSFGYFPSYALGSAFGAQLYHHMKQEMDFEGLLESGDIGTIREYLREHIHQYGKLKDSRRILKDVTGEDFNPQYYIDYLKEKYSKLYGLNS